MNTLVNSINTKAQRILDLRSAVKELQHEIDRETIDIFHRYFFFLQSTGEKLSCYVEDYGINDDIAPNNDLIFIHDCREHGSSVSVIQRVILPFSYLENPEGWEEEKNKELRRMNKLQKSNSDF